MAVKILVVDDEPAVTDLLVYNLRRNGYEPSVASDGHTALSLARQSTPDLVLLDLMIPGLDGLEVCRELRKTSRVPIIMVTALGEEVDRVVGLELGADDYICKPFSVRELLARIKAVLRRNSTGDQYPLTPEFETPVSESAPAKPARTNPAAGIPPEAQLSVVTGKCGLRLDPESRQARVEDKTLDLTRLEFDLLYLLLANAGRVLSRERLLEMAWGYEFPGDTRAVDSAIKRLRARLRSANPQASAIETVRGIGYRYNG